MMFVATPERAAVLLLVISSIHIHLALDQLVVLSECVCPGRELRLECTVVGLGSTVWSGTAFDCPEQDNDILLRHTQFESVGAVGQCNNGTIIGQSHNRTFDGVNSTFTSQLIVHLPLLNATNNTLDGETVECIYDDGVTDTTVDTHTIAYMRALPPDNIHLAQVSKNALTFQWDPVQSDIEYKVNAMNCGMCPNTIFNKSSLTCYVSSVFTSNNSVCTLSIETTGCTCEETRGNKSDTVTAILKAPELPTISSVLPYYYFSSRELAKVVVEIKSDSIERFNISDGIDGSITSYAFSIIISNLETNCTSPTAVVPVSSCVAGVCTVTLANLTSLPCYKHPSQAEVTVYASNVLTDGPPSTTSLLNTSNSLFFVEYASLSNSFSCLFVGNYENKSCEITYGAMDPTDQMCAMDNQVIRHMNSSDKMSNTVIVFIPSISLAQAKFCFTAIGKTPNFTIAVEGTFTIDNIDTRSSGNANTRVILIAVISVISCVIIALLLAFIAGLSRIISKKKDTLKQHEYTDQDEQQYDRTTVAQRQLRQVPSTHSEQTDEQQYDQIVHQQHRNSKVPDQAEEQQYDQIFIQKQSKQMVYSELGPTITGKKWSNFVLGGDDRIEYAELDHKLHSHAAPPSLDTVKTVTTCLTTPPEVGCNLDKLEQEIDTACFDITLVNFSQITNVQEDSPPPPPLPPKYTMM